MRWILLTVLFVWVPSIAEAQIYGAIPGPTPARFKVGHHFDGERSADVQVRWQGGCEVAGPACEQPYGVVGRAFVKTGGAGFGEAWWYATDPWTHRLWALYQTGVNLEGEYMGTLRTTWRAPWEGLQANFDVQNLGSEGEHQYVTSFGVHHDRIAALPAWRWAPGSVGDGVFGINFRVWDPSGGPSWVQARWEPETDAGFVALFLHW